MYQVELPDSQEYLKGYTNMNINQFISVYIFLKKRIKGSFCSMTLISWYSPSRKQLLTWSAWYIIASCPPKFIRWLLLGNSTSKGTSLMSIFVGLQNGAQTCVMWKYRLERKVEAHKELMANPVKKLMSFSLASRFLSEFFQVPKILQEVKARNFSDLFRRFGIFPSSSAYMKETDRKVTPRFAWCFDLLGLSSNTWDEGQNFSRTQSLYYGERVRNFSKSWVIHIRRKPQEWEEKYI